MPFKKVLKIIIHILQGIFGILFLTMYSQAAPRAAPLIQDVLKSSAQYNRGVQRVRLVLNAPIDSRYVSSPAPFQTSPIPVKASSTSKVTSYSQISLGLGSYGSGSAGRFIPLYSLPASQTYSSINSAESQRKSKEENYVSKKFLQKLKVYIGFVFYDSGATKV